MRSILLKDYLEQRMYFLIILAVAVVSLLVAAWFKQLDSGVAMFLLFALQGPLFIYLAAHHQISSEVSNRTFPFLLSLPISRGRLWLAKLLFVFIYAALLYAIYVLLALICGATPADFYKLFRSSPALGFGPPLVIIAYGYFTSMLPRGFATISALIIGPAAFYVCVHPMTLTTLNYSLGASLLIVMFLALSAAVFMSDRTMSSPWRGVKGLIFLVIGSGLLLTCWLAIDAAAEASWSYDKEASSGKWLPVNDGKKIVWALQAEQHWWDVADPGRSYRGRLFLQNLETAAIKQVGSRFSNMVYSSEHESGFCNNSFAIVRASRMVGGLLRGYNHAVVDSEGNLVKTLPSPSNESIKYVRLIDDNRFIYAETVKNGNSVITEFSLYEKGKGEKIVFSAQNDFIFRDYVIMPAEKPEGPVKVFISGVSESEPEKQILVEAADGKRLLLLIAQRADVVAAHHDFVVFDEGQWNNETKHQQASLVLAYLDGRIERLDWLTGDFEVVGITANGNILALKLAVGVKEQYLRSKESLVEFDIATKQVKDLLRFPHIGSAEIVMTPDRDRALLYYNSHDAKPVIRKFMAVDLKTGKSEEFSSLNSYRGESGAVEGQYLERGPFSIGGNRFLIEAGCVIYNLDVSTLKADEVGDIFTMIDHVVKGGGKS